MRKKTRFVRTLRRQAEAEFEFVDVFVLGGVSAAVSSRGDRYLRLALQDRTGAIEAFVWDDVHRYEGVFQAGDVVEVWGRVRAHRGRPQVHVSRLRRLEDKELAEMDPADLRPGLDRAARERCWRTVDGAAARVEDPNLRRLLDAYLKDPEFRKAFEGARAAKGMHHSYEGGLLEHTAALLELVQAVAAVYGDRLNRDLLIAGAFLHDAAKILEMDPKSGEYTDAGRLVGHLVLGVTLLEERIRAIPGFPEDLRLHLMHLILAHHERSEWGSPVKPQTLEALVLHHLDLLDARVGGATAWIEQEGVEPGEWTGYWRAGETQLQRTPLFPQASPRNRPPQPPSIEQELLRAAGEETDPPDGEEAPTPAPSDKGPRQGALF